MDPNFTFPRPQAPTPRPPPPNRSPSNTEVDRGSNALRASVLDVALQLGFGTNSTVADWIFNNSLPEEEEENVPLPSVTNSSTETSGRISSSTQYPTTLSSSIDDLQPTNGHVHQSSVQKGSEGSTIVVDFERPVSDDVADSINGTIVTAPETLSHPTPSGKGKLKKKRPDGYESDGGHVSEGGKKERTKEAKSRLKGEKMQAKKEKEEERKRTKSLMSAGKGVNKIQPDDKDSTSYETDGIVQKTSSKKDRSKPAVDVDFETDSGYLSSSSKGKSKRRFFGLGAKRSKLDLHQDQNLIAIPIIEKDPVPLPIASKFAKTLLTGTNTSSTSSIVNNPATSPSSLSSVAPSPVIASSLSPVGTLSHQVPLPVDVLPTSRDSYTSAESGSLSPGSSGSHLRGRGSSSQGHENGPKRGRPSSLFTSTSQTSLPPSINASSIIPGKLFPVISLPLTHTSPSPAIAGHMSMTSNSIYDTNSLVPSYPSFAISSTSSQPAQSPSPRLTMPGSALLPPSISSSPVSTPSPTASPRPRPRFPPTDGFGPRPSTSPQSKNAKFITSPSSAGPNQHSPSMSNGDRSLATLRPSSQLQPFLHPHSQVQMQVQRSPSPLVVPSEDYIVPSPLPSPNVLAYYDIPPPSPPPVGPLPSIPHPGNFTRPQPERVKGGGLVRLSGLRNETTATSPPLEQGLLHQPIPSALRGREMPFPPRPVLRQSISVEGKAGMGGQGIEASVKEPRYRELYALALPEVQERRVGDDWKRESEFLDEDEEEDIKDVLERFEEVGRRERQHHGDRSAFGRSRSFEAIEKQILGNGCDDDDDDDDDDRNGEFDLDGYYGGDMEEDGEERGSVYSRTSYYSRASFLDPDKSEEARERFVRRVEEMYGSDGRERDLVPPVPKIPEAFAGVGTGLAPGRSWNRF